MYVSGRNGRQTVNASDFALKVYFHYCHQILSKFSPTDHALSAFGFMVTMTTAFLFTFFYTVARTFSVRVGETRSEDSDDDYHSSANYDIH